MNVVADIDEERSSETLETHELHNKKGLHILADFYDCTNGHKEMLYAELLETYCEEAVRRSGLTQVGKLFYQFPDAGVTGTVLLAESHIAIHTWPEKNYLTLDVFVCNVTGDNTEKARNLYRSFERLFQPGYKNLQEVERE